MTLFLATQLIAESSFGFSIESVEVAPQPLGSTDDVTLLLEVHTPRLGPDFYLPPTIDRAGEPVNVEIFVTSTSRAEAIGERVFEVSLGSFPAGAYSYHVHLTPDWFAGWGVRDVLGSFHVFLADLNGDGRLDQADINQLSEEIRSQTNPVEFDVNGDGVVDSTDRIDWIKEVRNTYVGDANLDGEFNSGDLVAVFTVGMYESGQGAGWAEGDWNGDGVFGSGDLVKAFEDGGYEQGPRAGMSAVPEPSTALLLALAATITVSTSRRKRF
jgi:hypothetical protein